MLATLALASLLGAAAPTQATGILLKPVVLQAASQIAIDGHYYTLPPGTLEVRSDGYVINATPSMSSCARPNGAAQVVTANSLRWGSGGSQLYLAAGSDSMQLKFRDGAWALMVQSATGDVSCAGEVMPTGVLFMGGFE